MASVPEATGGSGGGIRVWGAPETVGSAGGISGGGISAGAAAAAETLGMMDICGPEGGNKGTEYVLPDAPDIGLYLFNTDIIL